MPRYLSEFPNPVKLQESLGTSWIKSQSLIFSGLSEEVLEQERQRMRAQHEEEMREMRAKMESEQKSKNAMYNEIEAMKRDYEDKLKDLEARGERWEGIEKKAY